MGEERRGREYIDIYVYFYKLFMAFREEPFTEYIDFTSVIKRKGEKEEKNRGCTVYTVAFNFLVN